MTELQSMSIDDVESANRWIDAFDAARVRARKVT